MAPINDAFEDAIVLSGSLPIVRTGDTNVDATAEVDEPTLINYGEIDAENEYDGIGASVWYSWECPSSGVYRFRIDTDFDSVLSIYTGAALGSLTRVAQSENVWSDPFYEECHLDATAGTTYYLQAAGYDGQTGNIDIELAASSRPANDLFASAVALTSGIVASGSTFGASIQSGEPRREEYGYYYTVGKTVWYSFTAEASENIDLGVTATGRWGSEGRPMVSVYTGASLAALTLKAGSSVSSGSLSLSFVSTAGTTYFVQVGAAPGYGIDEGDFDVEFVSYPPFFPSFATAITLVNSTASLTADNTDEELRPGEPANSQKTVWWRWTASGNGLASMDTGASDFFTTIAVYRDDGDGLVTLIVGLNYGGIGWNYESGETYYIQVGSGSGMSGVIRATFVVTPALDTTPSWEATFTLVEPGGSYAELYAHDAIFGDGRWMVLGMRYEDGTPYPLILSAPSVEGPWDVYKPTSTAGALMRMAYANGYWAGVGNNYYAFGTTLYTRKLGYWVTDDPSVVTEVTIPQTTFPSPQGLTSIATDGEKWAVCDKHGYVCANTSSTPVGPYSVVKSFTLWGAFRSASIAHLNGEWVACIWSTLDAGSQTYELSFWTADDPAGSWTLQGSYQPSWWYSDNIRLRYSSGYYIVSTGGTGHLLGTSLSGPWTEYGTDGLSADYDGELLIMSGSTGVNDWVNVHESLTSPPSLSSKDYMDDSYGTPVYRWFVTYEQSNDEWLIASPVYNPTGSAIAVWGRSQPGSGWGIALT